MAYTVKQVSGLSGVSVRTLHFYHECGLLKPAYLGANGYRFYEEPQLLMLQQILFYRELGFELKQIKKILRRKDFEKVTALESHRKVLQKGLTRTRSLIETIDKTIKHLKGTEKMKSEEMFAGFSVAAGQARFDEKIQLGEGYPVDCKVSGKDTGGAMCIFEFTTGWPRHKHDQDEWVYIVDGEWNFEIDKKRFQAAAGESVFIPRNAPHAWGPVDGEGGKVINVYQPAGKMEEFMRATAKHKDLPTREQAINNNVSQAQIDILHRLFSAHDIGLLPPLEWEKR